MPTKSKSKKLNLLKKINHIRSVYFNEDGDKTTTSQEAMAFF
jgi:hypothetical protein